VEVARSSNASVNDEDFVAWLEDQARRARGGEIGDLDLENIAEELEGMARSDRREIRNRLAILVTHLLKCSAHTRRSSASWLGTIAEQRDGIADLIEDSPSLRDYPAEILELCYLKARRNAARQMRCRKTPFPRPARLVWNRYSTRTGCPRDAGHLAKRTEGREQIPTRETCPGVISWGFADRLAALSLIGRIDSLLDRPGNLLPKPLANRS
jgi:hypothetical protein